MHSCPRCDQACYCDLDDSNDALGDAECEHDCAYEEFVCGEGPRFWDDEDDERQPEAP